MKGYHELDSTQVLQELRSDASRGLGAGEARERLGVHGYNELHERGVKSPWSIFVEQLSSAMVLILIFAAALSGILGDFKNALAIGVIVLLNAVLGFVQEFKAEKAMAALKAMSVPQVRVRRDGTLKTVSARELVPGDIVLFEAGSWVPADCRILESFALRIQEAALTGESEPVEKTTAPLAGDRAASEKSNMAFMGTLVTYGRGEAVVAETGMNTELGRIAELIQQPGREATPLQKRLDKLGKQLAWIALGIVSVVFILGLVRGEEPQLMFMTAVSLAVAAVPEGLPAVVTIALALGAQRMLRRRALIRKLPAVETLGSVTVICSDKTGTLTENRMTVTVLDGAGCRLDMTRYLDENETCPPEKKEKAIPTAFHLLLTAGTLCNDAVLPLPSDQDAEPVPAGDPTETALVSAACRLGLDKNVLEKKMPRRAEKAFDSERKRMTTVHELSQPFPGCAQAPFVAFTKGAVDPLLEHCTQAWMEEAAQPLTAHLQERIIRTHEELAQSGMRVLGMAFRPVDSLESPEKWEEGLIFVGMIGLVDPARSEARQAIEMCHAAGVRPVMITGDHPLTARYVARQLGIPSEKIMTGKELEALAEDSFEQVVEDVSVYARVTPEHKLHIIRALQKHGHVVAMTGDGVNDAPALKKSDIGVAMGITGTDVSKEAADMVLLDDNFATIVTAVEEGRVIYDDIRKFIKYLMTTNSAEITVMLAAPFLGMPLPLLPLQILWINLITDGPVALALGVEPGERYVMQRPPYAKNETIFGRGAARHILWVSCLISLVTIAAGYFFWHRGSEIWQTVLFTTLALTQLGHATAIRSERDSIFKIGFFSNKYFFGALMVTLLLQLAVVYVPAFQAVFKTVPLHVTELAFCGFLASLVFLAVEGEKWLMRLTLSKKGETP